MIPSSVRIKAKIRYEIVYQDEIKSDPTCLGMCCDKKRTIYLKIKQSETSMKKSFIHELLHAMEFEYKIKIPHESIYGLEIAIYNFLILNKLL